MLNFTLDDIKKATGITGDYQDATIQGWVDETVDFLRDSGVAESNITCGVVARGVLDLWNYGSGSGRLSPYFNRRVTQLALKNKGEKKL